MCGNTDVVLVMSLGSVTQSVVVSANRKVGSDGSPTNTSSWSPAVDSEKEPYITCIYVSECVHMCICVYGGRCWFGNGVHVHS